MTIVLIVGLFSLVAGALLAWHPIGMARLVGHFGMVKFDPARTTEYRTAGMVMAALGLILAVIALFA
ncbi:hypothetical protein AB0I95_14105 [Micromonospora sp. NPDC049751]|uniref:hypothetical protein n=1 Tax=Micromonospora sp. NPDC049751 TaxID=3154837 RepID=UPI0033CC7CCF